MHAKDLNICLKRAYEPPSVEDGRSPVAARPRQNGGRDRPLAKGGGAEQRTAALVWACPCKWDEFRRKYEVELSGRGDLLGELRQAAREGPLTLVYSARDQERNQAVVLGDVLKDVPLDN
jgi:hypothetical protein